MLFSVDGVIFLGVVDNLDFNWFHMGDTNAADVVVGVVGVDDGVDGDVGW